jgi:tellurite resistance protein TehA-like permease
MSQDPESYKYIYIYYWCGIPIRYLALVVAVAVAVAVVVKFTHYKQLIFPIINHCRSVLQCPKIPITLLRHVIMISQK